MIRLIYFWATTFTPGTSNAGVTCGVYNTNANERPSGDEHPSVRHDAEEWHDCAQGTLVGTMFLIKRC